MEFSALTLMQGTSRVWSDTRVRKWEHVTLDFSDSAFAASTKEWEIFGFHTTLKKDHMIW